ncbi:hypothetical protein Q4485_13455 [Granulosicoccaceae sp. 1_MG-2023]|nr:hypothetical protein [Granulosicoccaceae sp. 1_MG-2023]
MKFPLMFKYAAIPLVLMIAGFNGKAFAADAEALITHEPGRIAGDMAAID